MKIYILRGLSGAGKSTKAKSLVGTNGIIHSTDDVIASKYDYGEFFKNILPKTPNLLGTMHRENLENFKSSIQSGFDTIIVDNTNIDISDAKPYVIAAIMSGIRQEDIQFVDIGTNGLSAEELFQRNLHGVPLDVIRQKINVYETMPLFNFKNVLKSKSRGKLGYSAVFLDSDSRRKLSKFHIEGWNYHNTHMTIVFGQNLPNDAELGEEVELMATHLGSTDKAIAVKVNGFHSNNSNPHVTISVNPDGGKPVMSNEIIDWNPIDEITLTGTVIEVYY